MRCLSLNDTNITEKRLKKGNFLQIHTSLFTTVKFNFQRDMIDIHIAMMLIFELLITVISTN